MDSAFEYSSTDVTESDRILARTLATEITVHDPDQDQQTTLITSGGEAEES